MPEKKKHSAQMREYWKQEKRKQRAGKTESRSDNPYEIDNPFENL